MGVISVASGASVWRGYEYYLNKKVAKYNKINENEYEGKVSGSNKSKYNVFMDIEHPRKCKCDCPHAKDRRVVCKHIIAIYFTAFPDEANKYIKRIEEYEEEEEKRQDELDDKIIKYVNSLSKEKLKNTVMQLLYEGSEWVFDRFVRDNIDY